VARRGLITIALGCLWLPVAAQAQTSNVGYTGFATAFIGASMGGDIADAGWTPGASVVIIDANGIGAEVDVSHVRKFDESRFLESGITTLTGNVIGVWHESTSIVRPYLLGGVGLLRARACVANCALAVSRTDWAFDAGGGAYVVFNEFIGARADVRYFRYFQRHTDLPLTDNGFFDFWRTSIGLTVSWPIR
jgi:hypothetical protein